MASERWMRTDYTLSIYQDAEAGSAAILDSAEMDARLREMFAAEGPEGFQSFHVEQGETKEAPTEAEEAMRRRVYEALNAHGPSGWGPLLEDFAEGILREVDAWDDPDEDATHEIADGAVPVYTTARIELFTESAELACWKSDIGEADDMVTLAGYVLYDLGRAIADGALEDRREREEEEQETTEDAEADA